jgi:hypothetical protein
MEEESNNALQRGDEDNDNRESYRCWSIAEERERWLMGKSMESTEVIGSIPKEQESTLRADKRLVEDGGTYPSMQDTRGIA